MYVELDKQIYFFFRQKMFQSRSILLFYNTSVGRRNCSKLAFVPKHRETRHLFKKHIWREKTNL